MHEFTFVAVSNRKIRKKLLVNDKDEIQVAGTKE